MNISCSDMWHNEISAIKKYKFYASPEKVCGGWGVGVGGHLALYNERIVISFLQERLPGGIGISTAL